jgi:hypothetical protein
LHLPQTEGMTYKACERDGGTYAGIACRQFEGM